MYVKDPKRLLEVPHIQYGAWDEPGVSMFATVEQEPVDNILRRMKPLNFGSSDTDPTADPLVKDPSNAIKTIFRTVKKQVVELAAERNSKVFPHLQEGQVDDAVAKAMKVERNREMVETSVRQQMHESSQNLRALDLELERAQTSLKIRNQADTTVQERRNAYLREKEQARQQRERINEEMRLEEIALRSKADSFRRQLIKQMEDNRTRRRLQRMAEVEECQLARRRDEMSLARDTMQAAERKLKHRQALKQSLDEFEAMQKNIKESNRVTMVRSEVGLLDAMHEKTKTEEEAALRRRVECVETRKANSAVVCSQLSVIKKEKDVRDKLITDLLVREHREKDDHEFYHATLDKLKEKNRVRQELILLCKEREFHRKREKALDLMIPHDSTCFFERQYQMQDAREKLLHQIKKDACAQVTAIVEESEKRRAATYKEEKQLERTIIAMAAENDRKISEERIRILMEKPKELIYTLRGGVLTDEEIVALGMVKRN
ncbi:eukaryotic translation initiation factor 3 subunit A [Scaptodrosophila lebanonensis]|uniref:Eukaryotic translation initiation factor 3 subunit A n=1 Tax=Drosophila lebanonensis TaxID=7225 RepID=A0A6J2U0A4_DROLE|nr:eukaryotic translation initiation factor 3 subunit A [Scaptodrosophila lebanonensis]